MYKRQLYDIPIIGIIEPTAKYISKNKNIHKVGVVATAGTIRSNVWEKSILNYNNNLEILSNPCPLLAPMAEEGWIDNEIAKLTVHEYMKNLHDVDALVLGCTHYPLFVELFKNELRTDAEVINTGTVIANQLQNLLGENLFCLSLSRITFPSFILCCNSSLISSILASSYISLTSRYSSNLFLTKLPVFFISGA